MLRVWESNQWGTRVRVEEHDEPVAGTPLQAAALATLCQVSTAALGVAGFDGRLRWVNPAFVEAFGYPREELLAVDYLSLVHPDDVATVVALLGDLAATGSGPPADIRVRHRDGSWVLFQSSATMVDDLVYFSGFDRTDERRHAAALARANASLSLFSVGVAHDLRGLLSVIEGAAGQVAQLVADDPGHPDIAALSAMAVRNAVRARVFVGALLAVSRSETFERSHVVLGDVVAGAVADVSADVAASGAVVTWSPNLPTVWGNAALIQATLANLFANSIRYCGGSVTPAIVVEVQQTDSCVTVTIADNGPGIAAEDLEAVFEPFERRVGPGPATAGRATDLPPVPTGYGLGLALCRRVVEAHGGKVWANPATGGGTVMTMELPTGPPPT